MFRPVFRHVAMAVGFAKLHQCKIHPLPRTVAAPRLAGFQRPVDAPFLETPQAVFRKTPCSLEMALADNPAGQFRIPAPSLRDIAMPMGAQERVQFVAKAVPMEFPLVRPHLGRPPAHPQTFQLSKAMRINPAQPDLSALIDHPE